ncbi:MAG: class I SAM-dependent methyltransferase [Thermoplasmatota archaeon]
MKYLSKPFDEHTERYESWFNKNRKAYGSELKAVEVLLPDGKGLEVGVGSGRFSEPFSIGFGVDPSVEMLKIAKEKGLEVVRAVGEGLPFKDSSFDFVLIVTTICFFEDAGRAIKEAHRMIRDGGNIVIGFVDKESRVGRAYQQKKKSNVFYEDAHFYSVGEVESLLLEAGFEDLSYAQTIFGGLDSVDDIQEPSGGYGEGSFIVIRGRKA